MNAKSIVTTSDLERIRQIDTCTVSNAIERLRVRPRNEGQVSGRAAHCIFPELPPVIGYAVTGYMHSTTAPARGRAYHENMDWWRYVASIPEPRIMVVEDRDHEPGSGALFGELHAVIGQALHCVGYLTNGAVRDLPAVKELGFQLFAGSVAVSHKYAHISEYGKQVEIGGLVIHPGDLIHGDLHGVHTVPTSIASRIPEIAAEILEQERTLKEFCQSPRFSLPALDEQLQHSSTSDFQGEVRG